jgi:hypothetical protein
MEERGNQIQNPLSISLFCVIYIYIYIKCFLVKYFSMVKEKVVGKVFGGCGDGER